MIWFTPLIIGFIYFLFQLFTHKNWLFCLILVVAGYLITAMVVGIDYSVQTTDTEVWSGQIEDWEHTEEYDEWVPPSTTCTSDSKGNQTCVTTPGYWVHHEATNEVKTTDNGWIYVSKTPDGNRMDDSYPNKTSELKKAFPEGTATASSHTYKNKVQASYSIYRHDEIDLEDFPDLPEYPSKERDYFYIDRIVGSVPNKKEALKELNIQNTYLNKDIPDPEKPGKTRSWKQVNLIFVNVGEDKPMEYGFALQDYWEGGNKNDFVVSFSMDKEGNVEWVYPFSWSEVELLKLEVKDSMMNQGKITDFAPIVKQVSELVAEQFERKEFADFEYIQYEPKPIVSTFIWISMFLILFLMIGVSYYFEKQSGSSRKYY